MFTGDITVEGLLVPLIGASPLAAAADGVYVAEALGTQGLEIISAPPTIGTDVVFLASRIPRHSTSVRDENCHAKGVAWARLGPTSEDCVVADSPSDPETNAMDVTVLNDNGAWSWFMDERAVVTHGRMVVGSVRSVGGHYREREADPDWGNIEIAVRHLASGETTVVVLHRHLEQDDHDGPALLPLADGRLMALWTQHSQERKVYSRVSASEDFLSWGPLQTFISPGQDHPPYGGDNCTYSNPFQLSAEPGTLYNFYRGLRHQQNWMTTQDAGRTWSHGGVFLEGYRGYAPYFKYATDGHTRIHFIGTEDHPRNFDNSVYHGYVEDRVIYRSDGTVIGPLSLTAKKSGDIWDATRLFRGDPDNVAWVIDLHLDEQGYPVGVFSVQKDGRGLPRGEGGMDHRYHYARWDGERWNEYEIAYAGTRLFPREDDYTGGAAIDPCDTNSVVISTDAHPDSGEPLISNADGQRHHELFRGVTTDHGRSFSWTPVTSNSETDHLRPMMPVLSGPRAPLVWMRGRYENSLGPWTTQVVAALIERTG